MNPRRAVLLGAALLFFWKLGGHDLWAPDEPYFAEGAREMVVDGRWAVPHVNGVVTPDKPPLFFWLIALFSLPTGTVSSFTARLPSALAALGTVALTMRLGGRLLGPRSAALAGILLSTSYLFWEKARWSQTDSLLCCLVWVALSAFEAFRAGDARGRPAGLLFWLAVALAVLVKGPVGLLLPLGIALASLGIDGELGRWRRFAPALGPLLLVTIVGAWVAVATWSGPVDYSVARALKEHFLDRGMQGLHHRQPPWYYLAVLPPNLLPWTGLIPGALVLAWRRRLPSDRLPLVAVLFVVALFSISTEKRELYALPAFPAFALLGASLVAAACRWEEPAAPTRPAPDRRWVTWGQGILGGLLALVGAALPLAGRRWAELPPWVLLALGALLFAAGAVVLYLVGHGRLLAAVLAPGACFALAYLVLAAAVYPALEPRKSARPFALRIKEATAHSRAQGFPVMTYALANLPEAFAFYSDGVYTLETEDPARLAAHLEQREKVFAVVHGGRLDRLPPGLLQRLLVVEATHLGRREVLLVTNGEDPQARPLLQEGRRGE